MEEQFVDFYQILGLPLDADRNTLRKRINELYLEAQGNLDHRNFATRLKFQELFEATLPQARFVLLDDARRAEYLRLVRAFRIPAGEIGELGAFSRPPLPRQAPAPAVSDTASDTASDTPSDTRSRWARGRQAAPDGLFPDARGADIEPLPTARPAAEQLELQREELWKKWKAGLEEALAQEKNGANPDNRLSRAESKASPATNSGADSASASRAARETAWRQREVPSDAQAHAEAVAESVAATLSDAEFEARRTQHRREVTRELLVNQSLLWGCVGALLVVVPGVIALVTFVGHNYPRGGRAHLALDVNLAWLIGFSLLAAAAFGVAQALSKTMRRRKANEMAALTYEELLRQAGSRSR